jgi:hypothetical protein
MNDYKRIIPAESDVEKPLVQNVAKDSTREAESCLSEMKKISQLIETVSESTKNLRLL